MAEDIPVDYYEILQVSVNAEPETVHRVYRILAQRYHPDNVETGSDSRFRQIAEAYRVLSDPEERARYDAQHERQQQDRWRLVKAGAAADNDVDVEQRLRLTVLEVLFTKRRVEPNQPGLFHLELEKLTGRPREHLEFTIWYLVQKKAGAAHRQLAPGHHRRRDRLSRGALPVDALVAAIGRDQSVVFTRFAARNTDHT